MNTNTIWTHFCANFLWNYKKGITYCKHKNFLHFWHIYFVFLSFERGQMAQRPWSLDVSPLVLMLEMWSVSLVLSAVPWKDGCMLHVPPWCSFMRSIVRLLVLSSKRRHWSRNLKRCKLIVDLKISMPVSSLAHKSSRFCLFDLNTPTMKSRPIQAFISDNFVLFTLYLSRSL